MARIIKPNVLLVLLRHILYIFLVTRTPIVLKVRQLCFCTLPVVRCRYLSWLGALNLELGPHLGEKLLVEGGLVKLGVLVRCELNTVI